MAEPTNVFLTVSKPSETPAVSSVTTETTQYLIVGFAILALVSVIEEAPKLGGLLLIAIVLGALITGRERGNI